MGDPQNNGKIERFHKSLKSECIRSPLGNLEEAQEIIKSYVQAYNHERLHDSLNYLTQSDHLKGPEHLTKRLEDRKTVLALERSVVKNDGIFGSKTGLLRDRCKSKKCQFR